MQGKYTILKNFIPLISEFSYLFFRSRQIHLYIKLIKLAFVHKILKFIRESFS